MSAVKKFWKLGLGVLFFLAGVGGFGNGDALGGVGCLAIGAGLVFWWYRGRNAAGSSAPATARAPQAAGVVAAKGTYNREFSVAGVTYTNDDGTERQKLLEQIYLKKPPFDEKLDIGLAEYTFEGEPAIAVTVNGQGVGNLHKADRDTILKAGNRCKGFSDFYVGRFIPDDKPQGGYVYFAKVKVAIEPKK